MKKMIIFLVLIFVAYSCSNDVEDVSPKKTGPDLEQYNRDYKMSEISYACVEGCMYNYNLYTTANALISKAVSLNSAQLSGIQIACSKFCNGKVFEKLDVLHKEELEKQAIKNKKEDKSSDSSEKEIDSDIKKEVAKKKNDVKEKTKPDENKAFEDL